MSAERDPCFSCANSVNIPHLVFSTHHSRGWALCTHIFFNTLLFPFFSFQSFIFEGPAMRLTMARCCQLLPTATGSPALKVLVFSVQVQLKQRHDVLLHGHVNSGHLEGQKNKGGRSGGRYRAPSTAQDRKWTWTLDSRPACGGAPAPSAGPALSPGSPESVC